MTKEVKEHLQTSIFVNFHHVSWYPPWTHTAVSQLYMDNVVYSFHKSLQCNRQIMNCVLMVFQNQFHHLCCVHFFLICQAERCHLHDGCQPTLVLSSSSPYKNVASVHHHQTPTLTGSEFQGWKCSAYINCHTTKFSAWQCFHYLYHCT